MAARKGLSKKTRFEVFKRDGFVCQYCGSHPPQAILHVDHIIAVAEGGGNEADNLVTSCEACNLGKGARSLAAIPQSLQDKTAEIAEREAQLRGYQEILLAKRDRLEDEAWDVAVALDGDSAEDGFRKDWLLSIKKFIERLGYHEVLDSADAAVARVPWSKSQRFRYFCGTCWGKIREGQK
jgi:hypothetical protein